MHSYTLSLRIESATLDTTLVTEKLGIAPTQTRTVGQYRSQTSVWTEALWECEVSPPTGEPEWESLEEASQKLLDVFSPCADIIQNFRRNHDVYLWVGHFSSSFDGGPRLSPGILKALGNFGVPVWVDTYFSRNEEK